MTDKKRLNGRKPSKNQQNNTKSPFAADWIASERLLTVFATLWALCRGSTSQVDGSHIAQALQRLVRAERAPGGPYTDADGIIDPLTNAAIALFLQEQGVNLPALKPFVAGFELTNLEMHLREAAVPHGLPVSFSGEESSFITEHEALLAAITAQVRADMSAWPDLLATQGETVFSELLRADKTGEIRLMSQLFASSLVVAPAQRNEQFVLLGAANVFFWIGGMLFDDFLDEEGKPALLPIATASHRHALELYRQATMRKPRLHAYLEELCLQADYANTWEVVHARAQVRRGVIKLVAIPAYGDYWALADRSIGHLFGPLLLMHQGPRVTKAQLRHAEEGLRHYLIARQLNDDIHDWREDIASGQLSAVVAELLRGADVRPGNHRLTTLVPTIEQYFMDGGLQRVCALLGRHTALARESFAASGLIAATGGLEMLVARQETVMQAALRTHANHQKFLAVFTDGPERNPADS